MGSCVLIGTGRPLARFLTFEVPMGLQMWRLPVGPFLGILCVGFWNVLSLSEVHRLPYLSDELSRLRVDMVGLSQTRRPGSDETSSNGFTYYWSGMSNGHHVNGVAIGFSSRLQPSALKVDQHIKRLRLKRSLGFMSVVVV